MVEVIAVATSILALIVSVWTAWLTSLHRGSVGMTLPSMVVFAYDRERGGFVPKVMVRCLIFSTGERGHIVEALFARLNNGSSEYVFPVWGVDADDKLVRGGALFVDRRGVVAWHHFLAAAGATAPTFTPGTYSLKVVARIHGSGRLVNLWSDTLRLLEEAAPTRHDGTEQAWFDRLPESNSFQARRESRAVGVAPGADVPGDWPV